MYSKFAAIVAAAIFVLINSSLAGATNHEEATHQALRNVRDTMLQAVNSRDIEGLIKHIHPNVVLTAENGKRFRGVDAVKKFYNDVFANDGGILRSYQVKEFNVAELAILYGGDTAIGFGSAVSEYIPVSGPALTVSSQWTATLALVNGNWLVTAFQNTVDFTNNPLMDILYEEAVLKLVLPLGLGCFLIGGLIGWRFRRKAT